MASNSQHGQTKHSAKPWKWILGAIVGAGVVSLIIFVSILGQTDDSTVQERWDAFQFHLDEDERKELLAIPVSYDVPEHWIRNAERPLPLGFAHVISHEPAVTRDSIPELQGRDGEKVVVTEEEFLQFFIAYSNQKHPIFITTDSILNAFHVVLEDSIIRLETTLAAKLPNLLSEMRENLSRIEPNGPAQIVGPATRRAKIMLAVGHRLIDPTAKLDESGIATIVDAEVLRVVTAQEKLMPGWLGEPTATFLELDYSHYRPIGFYTGSEKLERYFRAVRWLQSIPFHVQRDHELLSLLLIVRASRETGWAEFTKTYHEFLGEPDDWDIVLTSEMFANSSLDAAEIGSVRDTLLERLKREPRPGMINDLVRLPSSAELNLSGLNCRVFSAYRLPESVLFGKTRSDEQFWPPTGLEICVALGSDFARRSFQDPNRDELLTVIDESRGLFADGKSIYADYLRCLSALLDEPDPKSPQFMTSEIWRSKSCQTVLSSWAQARHTYVLHAKKSITPANGGGPTARGFVEPTPEFYRRFGRLISRIQESLRQAGAMKLSFGQLELQLRELIRMIKFRNSLYDWKSKWRGRKPLSRKDRQLLLQHAYRMFELQTFQWLNKGDEGYAGQTVLAALVQLLDAVERQQLPEDPDAALALKQLGLRVEARWEKLAELCRTLEKIATKQLDGEPFNEADDKFLSHYGDDLAALLLYESYSALEPEDDVLRAVEVVRSATNRHFHVAVGRPRAIYVLYPHEGKEVLCRGAVLPYYEFLHEQPMTDNEWKALYDSPQRPKRPEWLNRLFAE